VYFTHKNNNIGAETLQSFGEGEKQIEIFPPAAHQQSQLTLSGTF
jgi:hypothetical protein